MTVINALALKPRFRIGFSPSASVCTLDELFASNWRRPPRRTGHANTPPGVDTRWARTHNCQNNPSLAAAHLSRVMM